MIRLVSSEETLPIQWEDTDLESSIIWSQESSLVRKSFMTLMFLRILIGRIDRSLPTLMTLQDGNAREMEPLLKELEMFISIISRLLTTYWLV